jgi:hypothetical protein
MLKSVFSLKPSHKYVVVNVTMKATTLLLAFSLSLLAFGASAQRGKIYGSKPDSTGMIKASQVESFMDKKIRISITIKGKVLKVTKAKGGWFTIDAGNGKTIAAHFKTYDVTLPIDLAGKYVIADGVAQKQLIADDLQHLAGDSVTGTKAHTTKANPKQRLTFEVKGLMIE